MISAVNRGAIPSPVHRLSPMCSAQRGRSPLRADGRDLGRFKVRFLLGSGFGLQDEAPGCTSDSKILETEPYTP